jgi:hypothetical protein
VTFFVVLGALFTATTQTIGPRCVAPSAAPGWRPC